MKYKTVPLLGLVLLVMVTAACSLSPADTSPADEAYNRGVDYGVGIHGHERTPDSRKAWPGPNDSRSQAQGSARSVAHGENTLQHLCRDDKEPLDMLDQVLTRPQGRPEQIEVKVNTVNLYLNWKAVI